jgi:membrane protein implicated in regulation of membrane protease activity
MSQVPRRLQIAGFLTLAGMVLVIISQFTGFYYTFDSMNRYQRAPGFIISYLIPFSVLILQLSAILKYSEKLTPSMRRSLLFFSIACIIASVLQVFLYGISLNNLTIVLIAALLYVFVFRDMNKEVAHARRLEIEHYKEQQQKEHQLFEQTAEALASAIDAKDPYTHGHSARVAMYSTQIAREAGKTEEECEKVYFAALLHDVGKIGVPSAVINKPGRLTDEEFAMIKQHPVLGNQILSSIQQSPYLSIGAHYHHERFDGRGYPTGLKGEEIPLSARIMAIADVFDALVSRRCYKEPFPIEKALDIIREDSGVSFDPYLAQLFLDNEEEVREIAKMNLRNIG